MCTNMIKVVTFNLKKIFYRFLKFDLEFVNRKVTTF